ncbi:Hypp7679 [Branchiostoma lanceolatum]|uniref:Hypp7679 protein n=1 Tax=Branchiostoma lanceolatum TaxID=7740 RepID=A0A8K0EAP7_BRALA|nr:Hypp7679 [Branchiostoma lanceolatum]
MSGTPSTGVPMDHLCRKFSKVQQANKVCDLALQNKLDNLKKEYFRNLRKSTDRIWRLQGTDTPPNMRVKPQRMHQRSVSVQDFKLPSAYNLKSLEKELTEVEDGEGDIRMRLDVRKRRYSLPARPSTAISLQNCRYLRRSCDDEDTW